MSGWVVIVQEIHRLGGEGVKRAKLRHCVSQYDVHLRMAIKMDCAMIDGIRPVTVATTRLGDDLVRGRYRAYRSQGAWHVAPVIGETVGGHVIERLLEGLGMPDAGPWNADLLRAYSNSLAAEVRRSRCPNE